jgi:[1-hydroxy-2-(trimethylamino)ethyl]phosphonate dioxygenase
MKLDEAETLDDIVARVFVWLDTRGRRAYGEGVTQLEHALQCGELAREAGAPPSLVVAALLHDIGHLMLPEAFPAESDDRHEAVGARLLRHWFREAVVVPVALHVRAKRYLVAVDPGYRATLSEASARSLALQGGALTAWEVGAFEVLRYADAALALRRWDDAGKVPGRVLPPLDEFADLVASQIRNDP